MLKEMEFTNHQHRRHIMKMKIIYNHRKCQMSKCKCKQLRQRCSVIHQFIWKYKIVTKQWKCPIFINVLATPTNAPASSNTIVKQKHNNVFFHVIKSSNKNNHVLEEIMDKINIIQLEIEQRCSKIHKHNFK
jgi:hypothetical protein